MPYELDIFFCIRHKIELRTSIKFDLNFNLKFLVNTVLDFRRQADVARSPCHKVSPYSSRTKNDGSLIIIERIFLRIVIGSKMPF